MPKKVKPINTREMPVSKAGKPKKGVVAGETWHGTITGYVNHKCRCDRCRERWSKYTSEYRAEKFSETRCKAVKRDKDTGKVTWRCKRNAWAGAGNGLCHVHHKAKMARKGKKRVTA